MERSTGRLLAAVGVAAALGAAGTAWGVTRRRDVAALAEDPDRDVLTSVPPGRPTSLRRDDGTVLHVRVAGPTGRAAPRATIVFAHGWGMAIRFWIHQLRDLARDHLVVAYDQRGHDGSSEVGSDGFDIDALGGDLAAVVDAFAAQDLPVVVVGHSLGGMSILAAGRRDDLRQRADGAVLIDTGAGELTRGLFRGLGALEVVGTGVVSRAMRSRLPVPKRTTPVSSRVVRAAALGRDAPPSAVALTEQLFLDTPVDARAAVGMLIGDLDLTDALPRWTVPTTVIVGSDDRLTPPHHARRLARELPDAELVELPGVGHQAPIEVPDRVTAIIRDRVDAAVTAAERAA